MYCGVVEGFYWTADYAIDGQYGEFSTRSRERLLEFMGEKGLNSYLYDPKILRGDRYERAYDPSLIGSWKHTTSIAKTNNIRMVWGLAPGRHELWKDNMKGLLQTVERILQNEFSGIALLFDDVPGGATETEMREQILLTNTLQKYCIITGFCPTTYHGKREELEQSLLAKALPQDIPLIFTGKNIWSSHVVAEDIPQYRSATLWDNWMAADSSDPKRLQLAPPKRDAALLSGLHEYLLNLCFPVERVIPMVSAIGQLSKTGKCDLEIMAKDWAQYLHSPVQPLQKLIAAAPTAKYEYAAICAMWPSLLPLFEQR